MPAGSMNALSKLWMAVNILFSSSCVASSFFVRATTFGMYCFGGSGGRCWSRKSVVNDAGSMSKLLPTTPIVLRSRVARCSCSIGSSAFIFLCISTTYWLLSMSIPYGLRETRSSSVGFAAMNFHMFSLFFSGLSSRTSL